MLQVRCAAHILQLCLKTPTESCAKLKRVLNRMAEIVTKCRQSSHLAEIVEEEFGKSLRQRTAVRWNSSFPMAKRATQFDWDNSEIPQELRPTPSQLAVLHEFVELMAPFEEVFKKLQRQDYPVVCYIMPATCLLKRSIQVSLKPLTVGVRDRTSNLVYCILNLLFLITNLFRVFRVFA